MPKSDINQRQPRPAKSFGRNPPNRNPQNRVLIVCEGETEEIYSNLLCAEYKLQSVVVVECAEGGTPVRVVELASKKSEDFDQSWSVLDTEDITNRPVFYDAINKAASQKISLAVSNPCVEFWFYLHFDRTTVALANAHEAIRKLKSRISDYDKNQTTLKRILLQRVLPLTNTAIENANWCLVEMRKTGSDDYPNPCTTVGELVKILQEMAENKPY